MAQPKTQVNDADVIEFLNSVSDDQKRGDALTVHEMMGTITRRGAKMWGTSIVGFGSYQTTNADGRKAEWMITGFSPRKSALTLYIMGGFSDHDELLAKLGKYKTGKSCLYIKRLADIDQKILARLIRASVAYMRRTYPTD